MRYAASVVEGQPHFLPALRLRRRATPNSPLLLRTYRLTFVQPAAILGRPSNHFALLWC